MIAVKNITVQYGQKKILDDVTLDIPQGQLSVLIGKNGAGKSTLLKTICANIDPAQGNIYFGKQNLRQLKSDEIAKQRAVVMQQSRISFSFTVFEMVLMGRTPHTKGFEGKKDYNIACQCMERMQISHLRERKYPTLSGGEQQRVQLARALAQIWERIVEKRSCYLLLDEPTSSLDIAHQHQLLSLLSELTESGVTIFTILHDLNLAAQYGQHVHVLKQGSCIASGKAEQIFQHQVIEQAFECPVKIMHNPHHDCPLVVGTAAKSCCKNTSTGSPTNEWAPVQA